MQPEIYGFTSLITMCALVVIVLHPRIHEGLWIKAGLCTMILSLLASAMLAFEQGPAYFAGNAELSLHIGLLIVCAGYGKRYLTARRNAEDTDFDKLSGF